MCSWMEESVVAPPRLWCRRHASETPLHVRRHGPPPAGTQIQMTRAETSVKGGSLSRT